MHLNTLRALTWVTVAAALVSALWLAAAEFGGGDFGREDGSEDGRGLMLPGDAPGTGAIGSRPATTPRGGSQTRGMPTH